MIRLTPAGASFLYGIACAAVLLIADGRGWEKDRGGYVDSFRTFYHSPYDKAQHAGIAFGLTLAATWLGVPLLPAAAITLVAGFGWELLGWFSWRDLVADAIGIALAVVLLSVFR